MLTRGPLCSHALEVKVFTASVSAHKERTNTTEQAQNIPRSLDTLRELHSGSYRAVQAEDACP